MSLSPLEIEAEIEHTLEFFLLGRFTRKTRLGTLRKMKRELVQHYVNLSRLTPALSQSEFGLVALAAPKTAALLADRVWLGEDSGDPKLGFGWSHPAEIRWRAACIFHEHFEFDCGNIGRSLPTSPPDAGRRVASQIEKEICFGIRESTLANVLPFYASESALNEKYQPGDQSALVSIVRELNIVDERSVSWDQVLSFRQDKDARAAYRRFVHWLDKEIVDKSVLYIVDEINGRLERYEWSLRKHGIATVVGAMSSLLNPKSLVSASSAAVATNVIAGQPIWSLLAGGGLLAVQATLSIASTLVERQDILMANREIAYVQQMKGLSVEY